MPKLSTRKFSAWKKKKKKKKKRTNSTYSNGVNILSLNVMIKPARKQ